MSHRPGKNCHAFSRNDFCACRNREYTNLAHGFNSFAFNDDDAVANRLAAKSIDQCSTDECFDIALCVAVIGGNSRNGGRNQ